MIFGFVFDHWTKQKTKPKMESTTSKSELMKPIFLKAGIPLALSVAGFIYARIIVRRSRETKVSTHETVDHHEQLTDEASHCSPKSSTSSHVEDDEDRMIASSEFLNLIGSSDIHDKVNFEEELLQLRGRVEELQKRERDLENKFLCYHAMKEQESLLMELRNTLLLETTHVEFLDRQISSMEAENQRFENLMAGYHIILQQLDFAKMENGLLRRKAKKLVRKKKEKSRVVRENKSKIEAQEAEILRCRNELETRTNVIKKLEDEIREMQAVINQLQEEKNELLIKAKTAEHSASHISMVEEQAVTMEEYNKLTTELEQLRKDRASEIAELIYMRWTNACLRHELMRLHVQEGAAAKQGNHTVIEREGSVEIEGCGLEQYQDGPILGHGDTCLNMATSSGHAGSKKKKLLKKLRKWVEGSDGMKAKLEEKDKHETKCFPRLSVSEQAEDDQLPLPARRSYSSA